MSRDYVPSRDQDLDSWFTNFLTMLSNNLAQVGLVAADITPLDTASTTFQTALQAYLQKKPEMDNVSSHKRTSRAAAVDILRPLVRRINNHPGMDDDLRALLGLPVRGEAVRTPAGAGPEVPGLSLETEPGSVIVHFGTEPKNERINGKPAWAKGCLVYRKRAGEENFQLVAWATTSPYNDRVDGPGADYTYYVLYRGTKATDIGQGSPQMTVAARGLEAAAA